MVVVMVESWSGGTFIQKELDFWLFVKLNRIHTQPVLTQSPKLPDKDEEAFIYQLHGESKYDVGLH